MKVKEIAIARKARKGPAHKITQDGAYWLAVDVGIMSRGGDGIGQSRPDITDYYRVRHYRDGSIRAYCETESHHQNTGSSVSRRRCDETLECETLEDLIAALKRTRFPDDGYYIADACFDISDRGEERLAKEIPELPASLPAPDEI